MSEWLPRAILKSSLESGDCFCRNDPKDASSIVIEKPHWDRTCAKWRMTILRYEKVFMYSFHNDESVWLIGR